MIFIILIIISVIIIIIYKFNLNNKSDTIDLQEINNRQKQKVALLKEMVKNQKVVNAYEKKNRRRVIRHIDKLVDKTYNKLARSNII